MVQYHSGHNMKQPHQLPHTPMVRVLKLHFAINIYLSIPSYIYICMYIYMIIYVCIQYISILFIKKMNLNQQIMVI